MASLALTGNVHPKVVQELLGHPRIETTMNIYSHTTPELQRDAADQLDALSRPFCVV
jgi:integrase